MWPSSSSPSTPIRQRRTSTLLIPSSPSPSPSLSDLQQALLTFTTECCQASLIPLLPPPQLVNRDLLRFWRARASAPIFSFPADTNWENTGVAVFPAPEPWRALASVPDHSPSEQTTQPDSPTCLDLSIDPDPPWVHHLLVRLVASPVLQFPWFELKVFLSYLLIKRLVYRFHHYLEVFYSDHPMPRDKLARFIAQQTRGAYLMASPALSETSDLGKLYSRDLHAFLEPRRTLVWHLRSYSYPPFTLPRLCELLLLPPTQATWGNDFWKYAFAVQRCLVGIMSAMPMDEKVVSKAPRLHKDFCRRLKRTVWILDTPTELAGFMWLSSPEPLSADSSRAIDVGSPTDEGSGGGETFHTPQPNTRKRLATAEGEDSERKRARIEENQGNVVGRQIHSEILMMRKELENSEGLQLPPLPNPEPVTISLGDGFDMFSSCG